MPIIAAVLIFAQAVGINFIATKFRLSEEITLFSGIFYILLTASIVELAMPTPTLLANTFLIVILYSLFDSYRKSASAIAIFNIGLWIGIGSLFHFGFIAFLLLGIIGLNVLRAFNFREILMLVVGALTAYWIVGAFYFIFDAFNIFWEQQILRNIGFLHFKGENNWLTYTERLFFAILAIVVIISQGVYSFKKNIQIQKFQTVLYWALLVSSITLLFQNNIGIDQLALTMPTLAFFMMYSFTSWSRPTAEALHLIWIFGVIVIAFHQFFGF